jgi:hypothetical protein
MRRKYNHRQGTAEQFVDLITPTGEPPSPRDEWDSRSHTLRDDRRFIFVTASGRS